MRLPPGWGGRRGTQGARRDGVVFGTSLTAAALGLSMATAEAQTRAANAPVAASQTSAQPAPRAERTQRPAAGQQMLLQADQIVYDNDRQLVIADGNVQIFHDGYTVTARRITYNRQTRRLIADGEVRVVDPVGNVTTGQNADLTDNLRDGFVRSIRLEGVERVRFAADSAERNEDATIFNRGVYTACEPCRDDPLKPPLWQVKAARIIHNQREQTVYFEDARLEFFGVPVAYVPYFWSPDPTVRRRSGLLFPRGFYSSRTGLGAGVPLYLALSPHYDLTITPMWTTRQGPNVTAEFRHQLPNGAYSIRASGIRQFNPDAIGTSATDEGRRTWRGAIQTVGEFRITERWRVGWDATLDSDRRYLKDYGLVPEAQRESVSTLFLQGVGERSFFDARLSHFRPLVTGNVQHRQSYQPIALPVIDYNTAFADPFFGGEVSIRSNLTNLTRAEALTYQLARPGGVTYFTPSFAGNYTRWSTEMSWRRTVTDVLGIRWTPMGSLRADVTHVAPRTTVPYTASSLANPANIFLVPVTAAVPGIINEAGNTSVQVMPAAGIDVRYPWVGFGSGISHVIEPIAQVLTRPNEQRIGRLPNEDAQSLVFDDTNLFGWNRFSGNDRIEGGTRLNAGVQYSLHAPGGTLVSFLFGQSHHLAGLNSFAASTLPNRDQLGTGLNSGLDRNNSDYVARIAYQFGSVFDVAARFRLDQRSWNMMRTDVDARINAGPVQLTTTYSRIAAQPLLGIDRTARACRAASRSGSCRTGRCSPASPTRSATRPICPASPANGSVCATTTSASTSPSTTPASTGSSATSSPRPT